jgi:hypothetical protein
MTVSPSLFAIVMAATAAAGSAAPEVKSIDARCKAAAKLEDARKQKPRVFADLSEAVLPKANENTGTWRSFETSEELKAYTRKANVPNTQASIWSAPDGTTIADMYFQSDTGDWSDDVEYCFRADGTLARLTAALSNYAADVEGTRVTHFDGGGGVLLTRAKAFALETRKRLPTTDGLDDPPLYPTVASLPFLAPPTKAAASPTKASASPGKPAAPPANPKSAAPELSLDPAGVSHYIHSQLGSVKQCYERGLATNGALAGRLVGHWTIEVSGATHGFSWESDSMHDPAVATCIQDLIARWRFQPAPERQIDVSFPFVFQSSGARDGGADGRRR